MVATETITINVPIGMSRYLVAADPESELRRNALLLYPYIYNQTIQDDLEDDINTFKKLKGMR